MQLGMTSQWELKEGHTNIITARANPTLGQFVGPKSWLLFELLRIHGGWLNTLSDQWDRHPEFVSLIVWIILTNLFVSKLEVVNFGANRGGGVKDNQDYSNTANDGAHQGRIILVPNSHWFKWGFTKHEKEKNSKLWRVSGLLCSFEMCLCQWTESKCH